MPSVLALSNVRRAFSPERGLFGVDLTVEAGEVVALVGPNGAGKTSLIRAITGRLRLDGGAVRVNGADPMLSSTRRQLGLVPQEIALYRDLPVATNLELLGRLAGLDAGAARQAVMSALTWIGLADRARSPVGELSGGQQRRVNLAAGTLHQPTLLVLDEPTVGVDPVARDRIHTALRDLRSRQVAILLATHDLAEAASLADRIAILVGGRVVAVGKLSELLDRHGGGAAELAVAFATQPTGAQLAALGQIGLSAADHARLSWRGVLGIAASRLPQVLAELAAAGLHPTETVLREPSLETVLRRLSAESR